MTPAESDLTLMLNASADGDAESSEAIYRRVYTELHRLAQAVLRPGGAGSTLQATALVHEAWMKLARQASPWESRGHYFSIAAKAMRCILVDHARARKAQKRTAPAPVTLDGILIAMTERSGDLLDLDHALQQLAHADGRKSQVVELKFFAGLTIPEIAGVLGVSEATVERDWLFAKAWLKRAIDD